MACRRACAHACRLWVSGGWVGVPRASYECSPVCATRAARCSRSSLALPPVATATGVGAHGARRVGGPRSAPGAGACPVSGPLRIGDRIYNYKLQ